MEVNDAKCMGIITAPYASKGVFLVTTTIAFVSFERDLSMNMNFNRPTREWAK